MTLYRLLRQWLCIHDWSCGYSYRCQGDHHCLRCGKAPAAE